MQLFGGIYVALCSVPLKVFVCFLFHGCFVWQVLFLWCLIGCVGLFSLTFCISFSNALLAVGFVVLLLLSSSASVLTGRAVLQMFVAFLLLHLLLGLMGACSPSLDFFSLSCMRAVHAFVPSFWEPFFLLVSLWLSPAVGWMPVGPGCLLVHVSC